LAVAFALALASPLSAEVTARGRLLGTSSAGHAWWVDVRQDGVFILHAAPEASGGLPSPSAGAATEGPAVRTEIARYDEAPDAIAAFGDRVWLTFPPVAGRAEMRDVVTLVMRQSVATGLFYADPPGGGELVASLRDAGELVGFAADRSGPCALFQASPASRYGVRRDRGSQSVPALARGDEPTFLRLTGTVWEAQPLGSWLPAGLQEASSLTLARVGDSIVVLGADQAGRTLSATLGLGTVEVVSVPFFGATWFTAADRPAVAFPEAPDIRFKYLRGSALLDWGRVGIPGAPWFVGGDSGGAVVVSGSAANYQLRRLGPIDSQAGAIVKLEAPGFRSGPWIHLPLLAAVALSAVIAFVFMRALPTNGGSTALLAPPPLSLERRALALAIDLMPGAIVAMWMFGATPLELLILPSWSLDRTSSEPAMVAILVTCLHSGVGELFTGRSFGKAVVGGVVVSGDGSPASFRQVFVRGILKSLTLCAPVLAVFVLFTQGNRSMGDVLSRTLVADARIPAKNESDAQN